MNNAVVRWMILLSTVFLISSAPAQTGGPYQLSWSTIDGGGGTSAGGSYKLTGTIGQPDAYWISGGIYELLGGFWPGVSGETTSITGDFCGAGSDQPDGYVDYWDLLHFAQHWHTRSGEGNWDPRCDLTSKDSGVKDNYVDYWDLLVFAQQWHKCVKS